MDIRRIVESEINSFCHWTCKNTASISISRTKPFNKINQCIIPIRPSNPQCRDPLFIKCGLEEVSCAQLVEAVYGRG